jgi:hypothetical protein
MWLMLIKWHHFIECGEAPRLKLSALFDDDWDTLPAELPSNFPK